MNPDELYMLRCLELAAKGLGSVAPNPMVGCIITCGGAVIGEGWHEQYGGPHAEVNAIHSVQKKEDLRKSCLYVNLEPCSHFGKTPPCADLIIQSQIPEVVIGTIDPFSLVCGKGIEKLQNAGIKVKTGLLEQECRELNKRFFTFHEKQRPYVILKWAETADGFIDRNRTFGNGEQALQISSPESMQLLHQWRSEESSILAGTNTALLDNPRLTVRGTSGKNPLRLVLDQRNVVPSGHHLKDGTTPTLIFNAQQQNSSTNLEYDIISFQTPTETIHSLLKALHRRNIQSVLAEGGAKLLQSFFSSGLWDEARVFISPLRTGNGISAPDRPSLPFEAFVSGEDELRIYRKGS